MMTVHTNFYDGQTNIGADDLNAPWASMLSNGVFKTLNSSLKVVAHSPAGLLVDVQAGCANINGRFIKSDSIENVPVSANTSGYNRIDAIANEVDAENKITAFKDIQGIPSSAPVPPVITDNQLILAQILVGNNSSTIDQNVITDKRISPFKWGNFV